MDRQKIARDVYDLAQSQEPIGKLVMESLDVIEQSLITYGPERISLSFNGGKDCTVLLHLLTAALARCHPNVLSIAAVYIPIPSPFPELENFITQAAKAYGLDLFTCTPPSGIPLPVESITPLATTPGAQQSDHDYPWKRSAMNLPVGEARGGEGMRRALEMYKSRFPRIQAILIGTRRTDPHGATLTHRNMCDPGWPSFERINPIINWSYSDVWTFLKKLQVPYCALYDQGYTSLGSTYNTFPNPALRIPSTSDASDFFPTSFVLVADNPNATCQAEKTPVSSRISLLDDQDLGAFTIVADDPESTCFPESTTDPKVSHHRGSSAEVGYGHFRVIAADPNTVCTTECTLLDESESSDPRISTPQSSSRYRPAYELSDGGLERAGRVPGGAFATMVP
ncbi:adenine nucleotide alpha hydrolases-like protein [Pisolithus thermaeus]|nr:adenine nucleotide alpha hydrolases-like protein [Pisolithus croceorrhizus]KAI6160728.1 adenine nucleotide alpha hydrolases-like protein [Pisolithus thermaeus]